MIERKPIERVDPFAKRDQQNFAQQQQALAGGLTAGSNTVAYQNALSAANAQNGTSSGFDSQRGFDALRRAAKTDPAGIQRKVLGGLSTLDAYANSRDALRAPSTPAPPSGMAPEKRDQIVTGMNTPAPLPPPSAPPASLRRRPQNEGFGVSSSPPSYTYPGTPDWSSPRGY